MPRRSFCPYAAFCPYARPRQPAPRMESFHWDSIHHRHFPPSAIGDHCGEFEDQLGFSSGPAAPDRSKRCLGPCSSSLPQLLTAASPGHTPPRDVTCIDWHPHHPDLFVSGCADGSIAPRLLCLPLAMGCFLRLFFSMAVGVGSRPRANSHSFPAWLPRQGNKHSGTESTIEGHLHIDA